MTFEQTNIGSLTDAELERVSGGVKNANTLLGAAFISGFLAGGGTMGNPGPAIPAGRGECRTNHNGVRY
jgi:hypothetical protein